ncbi:MAG: plasmid mobilization relaxosome protein MobC [Bacteroidota bacterium]
MDEKKKNTFKPKGGRNKIDVDLALSHRLKINLNKAEFEEVEKAFKDSGVKSMSEYLRIRLLNTKDLYVNDPKEILKTLDKLGEEVGRIGNNINQLAKYANILTLKDRLEPGVVHDMNELLRAYGIERKEIALSIRALLRKKRN